MIFLKVMGNRILSADRKNSVTAEFFRVNMRLSAHADDIRIERKEEPR